MGDAADYADSLNAVACDASLAPDERVAELRKWRFRIETDDTLAPQTRTELLGQAETYRGGLELQREGEALRTPFDLAHLRERADIRDALVAQGVASPEELDAQGWMSHDQLDAAREDGTLQEGLVGLAFDELKHPRDRKGEWRDAPGQVKVHGRGGGAVGASAKAASYAPQKPKFVPPQAHPAGEFQAATQIGITPYRGHSANVEEYRQSSRYKGYLADMDEMAQAAGVRIEARKPVDGLWEGSHEPADAVVACCDYDKIKAVSAALGKKYNQDGVMLFRPDEQGPGFMYSVPVADRDTALTLMHDHGFSGGRFTGDHVELVDQDGSQVDAAQALAQAAGAKLSYTHGHAEFIGPPYSDAAAVPSGPVGAGAGAVGGGPGGAEDVGRGRENVGDVPGGGAAPGVGVRPAPQLVRPGEAAPAPVEQDVGNKLIGGGYRPGESPVVGGVKPDKNGWYDVGTDVHKAADLLGQGKKVRLDQKREVSTLLTELARRVQEAKAKGDKAPNFDLCKVTVKGTNLFCEESKGIPRVKMPQLGGIPLPGSKADKLPKNSVGGVDLNDQFRAMLKKRGVKITNETEKASYLKATQNELNGAKVAKMVKVLDSGGKFLGDPRLFVSRDNYIVDGHHRWAANVGHDLEDGKLGDVNMPVTRVDMGITELLDEANRFATDMGIPQAGVADDPASVAAQLAEVRKYGLNDWPEKDDAAKAMLGDAKDTQELHTFPMMATPGTTGHEAGKGYSAERKVVHDRIVGASLASGVEDVLGGDHPIVAKLTAGGALTDEEKATVREAAKAKYGRPRALFMAGGPASGKTSALKASPELEPQGSVLINPDDIKGQLPEYDEMVKSGSKYAAMAVHEESSDLGKRLQKESMDLGLNVVVDGTGDSKKGKFAGKMQDMDKAGYDVSALYVTVPTDVAVVRATKRAMKSGRWVPEPEIRSQHKNVSANFSDVAKLPFLKDLKLYDNSGEGDPVLAASGSGGKVTPTDQGAYDTFLKKASE